GVRPHTPARETKMPSLRTRRATAASCGKASLAPTSEPASAWRSASIGSASTSRPTASTRAVIGCPLSGALATGLSQRSAGRAEIGRQPPPVERHLHLIVTKAVETSDFLFHRCSRHGTELGNQARRRRPPESCHPTTPTGARPL